jgi:hypothetical protein
MRDVYHLRGCQEYAQRFGRVGRTRHRWRDYVKINFRGIKVDEGGLKGGLLRTL